MALSLAPIDIMDTERLCVLPSVVVVFPWPTAHDPDPFCGRPTPTGPLSERAARCPLFDGGGFELDLILFLTCGVGLFRCLSPGANPLAGVGCNVVLDGAGLVATFLKVIRHSTSSPAKTVCSVHCTETRILVNDVDMSRSQRPTPLLLEGQ